MATTDTIPTQRYDIVHRKGTTFDRVFVIRDAYGRPVDVAGKNLMVTIGYLDGMAITMPVAQISSVAPNDADAQSGVLKVLLMPQIIDDYIANSNVPVGSQLMWKLEIEVSAGRWERPYEGSFSYAWW